MPKLQKRPVLMLFDLDGTLAHTLPQLGLATKAVAARLQLKVPSDDDMANYVGNGVTMLLARTIASRFDVDINSLDPALMQQARTLFNEEYLKVLDRDFIIYDGVKEGLQVFKDKGIKLAVVTNKPETFAKPLLNYMGLTPYFDFILGGEVLKERKPDPTPLFYVCGTLDEKPSDCIMVGDSANDILAGQKAKMVTVAFTYGYNCHKDVRESDPDYVFDSFKSLNSLILSFKD